MFSRWAGLLVLLVVVGLVLAACGEEATPAPQFSPTPTPKFQQENNRELFFTMAVPFGWNRNVQDANTVVYVNPKNGSEAIGVISRQIGKLTPTSKRLLEERLDTLKSRFPALRNDLNGAGTISLVDTTIGVDRLTYTDSNNTDVFQYLTQVNNVRAERAYILFAVSSVPQADTLRPLYLEAFRSFTSSAADAGITGDNLSGVADPTVIAANEGGKIRPFGGREVRGRVLRLVQWETAPLNPSQLGVTAITPGVRQPRGEVRIEGLFPYEYLWRLKGFPVQTQPAIYLESPVVDRTSSQAAIQVGVYRDALPANNPTADEWKRFYDPILKTLVTQTFSSYGSPSNITLSDVGRAGNLYRVAFTARSEAGDVQSRGVVLFSKSGPHGLVSLVSLSPAASVKQELYESLDADLQTMVNTFVVKL